MLVRLKDDYDGAEPAGSSMAAIVLLRLAELLERPEWRVLAERTLAFYSARLREAPHAMPQMLCAVAATLRPGVQIVIAGERSDPGVAELLRAVHGKFLPERTLLLADAAVKEQARGGKMPWVAEMGAVDGKPAAYVCKDHACERPVTGVEELERVLG